MCVDQVYEFINQTNRIVNFENGDEPDKKKDLTNEEWLKQYKETGEVPEISTTGDKNLKAQREFIKQMMELTGK